MFVRPGVYSLFAWLIPSVLILSACSESGPPLTSAPKPAFEAIPGKLEIAGSGAMGPLAGRFAAAWRRAPANPEVHIEPSVGSGGRALAAAEGAVDLGMVSRPLKSDERNLGLTVIPVALDAVVLATHPDVGVEGITRSELLAIFPGEQQRSPTTLRSSPSCATRRNRPTK